MEVVAIFLDNDRYYCIYIRPRAFILPPLPPERLVLRYDGGFGKNQCPPSVLRDEAANEHDSRGLFRDRGVQQFRSECRRRFADGRPGFRRRRGDTERYSLERNRGSERVCRSAKVDLASTRASCDRSTSWKRARKNK